ncbi:MAG TPA: hypothetical protein PKY86_10130 [Niabella sp.]|nr:hypothetical protein [Niabella sp.]HQW14924.1 hypothetical protein [Niabella sp.]HQX20184.1 hypothetical protein [Niabella sp.]HQX42686.1 hypothetical protein [Niabella sp.]HRB06789.1 hypothetical protein [Niabella sp.]
MSRIIQIEQLLKDLPDDSFLKHALALEYIKISEDVKAREIFENLLTEDPKYIGSYYHLAKLYERNGADELAIQTYEKGMELAKQLGDNHVYSELKSAWEDLTF